jgi:hypothetical protein
MSDRSRNPLPRTWARIAACALAVLFSTTAGAQPAPDVPDELARLRKGLGGDAALASVRSFDYRLQVRAPDGTLERDTRYRLDPASGAVCAHSLLEDVTRYRDAATRWRIGADGRRMPLADEDADALAAHAAYHFVRLLRDPHTRATRVGARVRLQPASHEAFEVTLDARDRIVANHFEDGTEVAERRHRRVDGVEWPMEFEVRTGPRAGAVGVFSEVVVVRSGSVGQCGASTSSP